MRMAEGFGRCRKQNSRLCYLRVNKKRGKASNLHTFQTTECFHTFPASRYPDLPL